MRIEYDPVHDPLNLEFLSGVEIEESVEMDGVILDYAKDRRIVALEVLDANKRTTQDSLHLINVTIVRQAAEKLSNTTLSKLQIGVVFEDDSKNDSKATNSASP